MPNQANVTVKKNDGTTDVTYTGVVAAAGDQTPAIWRNNAVGTASAFRPEARISAKSNASKTVRQVSEVFTYPVTAVAADGSVKVVHRARKTVLWELPVEMPDADLNEFVAQSANFDASAHVKAVVQSGYSAT